MIIQGLERSRLHLQVPWNQHPKRSLLLVHLHILPTGSRLYAAECVTSQGVFLLNGLRNSKRVTRCEPGG